MTTSSHSDSPPDPSASAFRYHNFRMFMGVQALSQIGVFFQIVAVSLLVLDLTGSGFALGLSLSVQAIPMLLAAPWAGVLVDRVTSRHLLMLTAILATAQALVLGVLVAMSMANIVWIAGLSFVLGWVQTIQRPASQAILTELVSRDAIPSAVALSSAMQSVGRLGGPAIAALLYGFFGPEWCFFVNVACQAGAVVALALFRKSELIHRPLQSTTKGAFMEGVRFAWSSPIHRSILLANAAVGCLAFNFPLFYASMVKEVFNADSLYFGIAESLNAVTALLGGILLARATLRPSGKLYAVACVALGISLTWTAISPILWIFLVGMLYFGAATVFYQTAGQSFLQQHTPPELIGRTMSIYSLGLFGTTPVGGLVSGWLIDFYNARVAVGVGAATLLLAGAAVWIATSRYARLGSEGVDDATPPIRPAPSSASD